MPTSGNRDVQVGSYRIIGLLGHGGFGDVHLGEHVILKRQAAIKLLRASLPPPDPNADTFPAKTADIVDNENKFRHEMEIISSFDHPNIVPLWEGGLTQYGEPYFVMPVVKQTLADHIGRRNFKDGTLTLEEMLEYLFPVASALDYMHAPGRKVVHGDIKPGNILRREDGTILLADFGSVVYSITGGYRIPENISDIIHATLAYMAPERFAKKYSTCSATDQYAVAIMIYKWISGNFPFMARDDKQLVTQIKAVEPPRFAEMGATVNKDVEQAIQRALAKNPDDRFPNVLAFVEAIEAARMRPINAREREQKRRENEERQRLERRADEVQILLTQAKERIRELDNLITGHQEAFHSQGAKLQELQLGLQQAKQRIQNLTNEKAALERKISEQKEQYKRDIARISNLQREKDYPLKEAAVLQQVEQTESTELSRLYAAQAHSFYYLRRYEAALQSFETSITLQPINADAFSCKGSLLIELGRYEEALQAVEQSLSIKPEDACTLHQKGSTLYELKRYGEALQAIEQSLSIRPEDAGTLHDKGLVLAGLGWYEEALQAIEQSLAIQPTDAHTLSIKGEVLYELKRYEEANQVLEQSLVIQPNSRHTHSIKMKILNKLFRYYEALKVGEKWEAIRPIPEFTLSTKNILSKEHNFQE